MHSVQEPLQIARALAQLPLEVVRRYEHWKDVVRLSGPLGLAALPGFKDRVREGGGRKCRTSDLGPRHRVIYRVLARDVRVLAVEPAGAAPEER
jgi:hypothetical protein